MNSLKPYWYWISAGLVILAIYLVQFSIPQIIGADGYLHFRMSRMIAQQGFLQTLPQAQYSWFATRFADKDFLYHLFLIPFSSPKIAAFTAASILVLGLAWINLRLNHPKWAAFSMLLLVFSSQFLRDISEPRPFVFAMILSLFGIYFLITRRWFFLAIIAFLYGMTHLSAYMLVIFAIATAFTNLIQNQKFQWQGTAATLIGWSLSFLIHPNFPNNIFYFYLNGILVPLYAVKTGVLELGAEFFPINTQQLLQYFPIVIFGTLYSLFLALNPKVFSRKTILLFSFWAIYFLLGLISRKNLTLGYPIFVLWLTSFLSDYFAQIRSKENYLHILSLLFAAIVLLYSGFQTVIHLRNSLKAETFFNDHYERVAAWMTQNIPVGQTIFHSNWSDSQYFIGLAPQYNYFVTLDPIYMYNWNQNLYLKYRDISFGRTSDPYSELKNTFKITYGYVGKNYFSALASQIRASSKFEILAEDNLGLVFKLKD